MFCNKRTEEDEEKLREHRQNVKEVSEELVRIGEGDILLCGPSFLKIKALQPLASRNVYMLVYSFVGLIIGMFFTYSVSTISTIEKRFKLSSKYTGIMLAGNDVSQIFLSVFVAYYGNYGNRPKWLAAGIFAASFACFLSAMPHFIYGPGQDAIQIGQTMSSDWKDDFFEDNSTANFLLDGFITKKDDLCYDPYIADCSDDALDQNPNVFGPLIIFFTAQFFVGCAVSTFYSIGLLYLDDNVNKKDTPVYYAASMIVRLGGPVFGFLLGSKCLSYYIDLNYSPNLSHRDPRWMGAWWLGYIGLGFLLCFSAFILLFFPQMLPATFYKKLQRLQIEEDENNVRAVTIKSDLKHLLFLFEESQKRIKPTLTELPKALKRLFTNKIWLGYNFNTVLDLFALVGLWNFKPKYLEYQFRRSAANATFYTGIAGLISSIFGLAISGIIIKCFQPRPRVITGYSCFLTVFNAATIFSLMFFSCPNVDVVGPNYQGNATITDIACSASCGCTDRYAPVCSKDGNTLFYSACYAGCTEINSSSVPVEYYDCKCIEPIASTDEAIDENTDNIQKQGGKAIQGYCPEKCESFFSYIIFVTVAKMISSTGRIGGTLIYLRSVEEHDKGLAFGVTTLLISALAFIPAPIMMGIIVDSTCIIWDNKCDKKGNCWLYDSDKLRILIHAVPAAIALIAVFGDIVVFKYSANVVVYEDKLPVKPKNVENSPSEKENSKSKEDLASELVPLKDSS